MNIFVMHNLVSNFMNFENIKLGVFYIAFLFTVCLHLLSGISALLSVHYMVSILYHL